MINFMRISLFFTAIMLVFGNINFTGAQNDSFMVTLENDGISIVKNKNLAGAKEDAVNKAVKKAVEEIVESIVAPEVLVANYKWINDIYSKSNDYVHSYSFLSEIFDETNNMYSVTLEITLYAQYIKSLLSSKKLLENNINTHPKVLFIIRELGLESSNEESFWETIPVSELFFTEKLQSEGIDVVNRDNLRKIVDIKLIQKTMRGDVQAAVRVGLISGAKIVITGNAIARQKGENEEDPTQTDYQANISLKAYQTDTGEILGARSEFMTISDDDPKLGEFNAFRAVGEKIYNSFMTGVILDNEYLK